MVLDFLASLLLINTVFNIVIWSCLFNLKYNDQSIVSEILESPDSVVRSTGDLLSDSLSLSCLGTGWYVICLFGDDVNELSDSANEAVLW